MLYTPRVAMIQAYAPHCEKRLGRKGPVTSISGALGTFGWVQQIWHHYHHSVKVESDWFIKQKWKKNLCKFCLTKELTIIETLLLHKNIHKYSVIVTKVQREVDANSDHYLVNIRVRLRLSTYKNNLIPRVDVQRLQNKKKTSNDCVRKKLDIHTNET